MQESIKSDGKELKKEQANPSPTTRKVVRESNNKGPKKIEMTNDVFGHIIVKLTGGGVTPPEFTGKFTGQREAERAITLYKNRTGNDKEVLENAESAGD